MDSSLKQTVARRSTLVSAAVNIVLSAAQIIVGFWAHSQALIADGLHSLSDLIADGVVLFVNRHSHKGPDDDHHYGHARFENAASLLLGLLLIVVGLGMLYSAVDKITDVGNIPTVHMAALWMALSALLAKEVLFRYMLARAQQVKSDMLTANAWHARSDAASSLVVSIGVIGNLLGYPLMDPLASLVIGLVICRTGGSFALKSLHQLTDRALPEEKTSALRELLRAIPGVIDVHDLKTRQMGDDALIDVHISVNPWISVSEGHWIAARARSELVSQPHVLDVHIHVDPLDADASLGLPLPMRKAVRAFFDTDDKAHLPRPVELQLHYLQGRLQLDVVFERLLSEEDAVAWERLLLDRFGPTVTFRRLSYINPAD
ncbi:MAG: cation diffusion facilitator family transporter [Burkholderiaceae bacterium]|jgi:cation diffusion facilitator family transporter